MLMKNFVSMIMGTIGGILFAVGMCMCLLPEWNAFTQGIVVACVGLIGLIALLIVRRKMEGKPAIQLNAKSIGTVALGVVGALLLGVGMCNVMVWSNMVLGIVIGLLGIVALLSLMPVIKGLK